MYKKREFINGAFYHVTSRTNNKIRVFDTKLGQKIMLITLQDAKEKFHFRLANFCIMPTHIHLLIQPVEETCLSEIMHWIKINSAKRWNFIRGSTDHMWGNRYYARAIKDENEYFFVMNYIDQNPVEAELVSSPAEWKASGAFHKTNYLESLIDYAPNECINDIKLLPLFPYLISNLLPHNQLEHTIKYYGVYAKAIKQLYNIVIQMPNISENETIHDLPYHLHYYNGTADYLIYEYDRQDTMYGKVCMNAWPSKTEYRRFNLEELKTKPFIKLKL